MVITICAVLPYRGMRSRPTSRLKSWSVPPSSMSAFERDRVVAPGGAGRGTRGLVDRPAARRSAWRSRCARACARRSSSRMSSTISTGVELVEPLGVVADLGLAAVEDLEGLVLVRLRGGADLFAREARARVVRARRVADHRGEVADEEDDLVPELLELPHLLHQDGVAEVQVGRVGSKPALTRSGPPRARGALRARLGRGGRRRRGVRIASCSSAGSMPCAYARERDSAARPRAIDRRSSSESSPPVMAR